MGESVFLCSVTVAYFLAAGVTLALLYHRINRQ